MFHHHYLQDQLLDICYINMWYDIHSNMWYDIHSNMWYDIHSNISMIFTLICGMT